MRSTSRPGLVAAVCAATLSLVATRAALAQQPAPIQASAMEQLRMLMQEKDQRTPAQRKLDSQFVMEMKRRRGDPVMRRLTSLELSMEMRPDDTTHVDVSGEITRALEGAIRRLGGTIENSHPDLGLLRAWLPLENLEALAARPDVRWVERAAQMRTHVVTSEGDKAHLADFARGVTGASGAGVKVCVVSDGVAALAALQQQGELPAVDVVPGQAGSGSEGTAMLEIIHDLAPGAQLGFATGNGGQAQFFTNVMALRSSGCAVIVDDIGYLDEAAFQDDIAARGVNRATESGAVYVSAAGNDGRLGAGNTNVWEGDFSPVVVAVPGSSVVLNDFGAGQLFNRILVDGDLVALSWSDPVQGSSNDYDLLLASADGATMLAASTSFQTGTQRPMEFIDSSSRTDTRNQILIARKTGVDRMLRIQNFRLSGPPGTLSIRTAGSIYGHPAAARSIAVGAADAGKDPNVRFPTGTIEAFSSDGPRRIFYDENGTPITPGNFLSTGGTLRQKPDIIGANRVSTATPNFGTFTGTSAAAPHIAGIAALVLSAAPTSVSPAPPLSTRQRLVLFMDQILVASGDPVPSTTLLPGDPKVIANASNAANAARSGLPCLDQLDNDGDGKIDAAQDPGCRHIASVKENPACDDGVDNDMDGRIDLADQGDCEAPFDDTECGSGASQSLATLPLLAYLARRKRKSGNG